MGVRRDRLHSPILRFLLSLAGLGALVSMTWVFLFTRPEYRFVLISTYDRAGKKAPVPLYRITVGGDTSEYRGYEQQSLLRIRTQRLEFMEPLAEDSSWGFVDAVIPVAQPVPEALEHWDPKSAPTSHVEDVFVNIEAECQMPIETSMRHGSQLLVGEFQGGEAAFGPAAYFVSLLLPYDSFAGPPVLQLSINLTRDEAPCRATFTRSTEPHQLATRPALTDLEGIKICGTKFAPVTRHMRFGTDKGFPGGSSMRGRKFVVPITIGDPSDLSTFAFVAPLSALDVQRCTGDLVVGSKHYQIQTASQLTVVATKGYVRLGDGDAVLETSGQSKDIRLNQEQLVQSRFESWPPSVQGLLASAFLGMLVWLARDLRKTILSRNDRRLPGGNASVERD